MHEAPQPSGDVSLVSEEKQSPLWTWLVLCDDCTPLSPAVRQVFNSVQTRSFLYTKILEPLMRLICSGPYETILIVF